MTNDLNSLVQHHPRDFSEQRYVYPVISRRAHGVSIGVNLSPTGLCNFHCVYCQVDGDLRQTGKPLRDMMPDFSDDSAKQCCAGASDSAHSLEIDLAILEDELRWTLSLALSGELFKSGSFSKTPPPLRRVNDIAFSGNGEPTLSPQFPDAVRIVVKVRNELGAFDVKPVVITNATRLQEPGVSEALGLIAESGGEIWAKLDAGTQRYYEQIDRSRVPFQTIIDNITHVAKRSPVIIQTLFLKMHGEPIPEEELCAYIEQLKIITRQGGQIKLVQFYTIARATAESWVAPLTDRELDAFANRVRNETGLPVETF
jgi:wyosine [tRNA(Phe)-imidazoG37] synthetase (radical SAM superfamily)